MSGDAETIDVTFVRPVGGYLVQLSRLAPDEFTYEAQCDRDLLVDVESVEIVLPEDLNTVDVQLLVGDWSQMTIRAHSGKGNGFRLSTHVRRRLGFNVIVAFPKCDEDERLHPSSVRLRITKRTA